jgi:hypothetical protein
MRRSFILGVLGAAALGLAPAAANAAPAPQGQETVGIGQTGRCDGTGSAFVTIFVGGQPVYQSSLPDIAPIGGTPDCTEPTASLARFGPGPYEDAIVSIPEYFYDFGAEIDGYYDIDIHYDWATRTWEMQPPRYFGIVGSTVQPIGWGLSGIVTRNQDVDLGYGPNTTSPVQVFVVRNGQYVDVTRWTPRLVAADAAHWWTIISAYPSIPAGLASAGPVAAWAADEYMLGRRWFADLEIQRLAAHPGLVAGSEQVSAAYIEQYLAQQGY